MTILLVYSESGATYTRVSSRGSESKGAVIMIHLVALIAKQWRGLFLKSFTIAVGTCFSGCAFAGSPADEAAQKLAGDGSRDWTFVQMLEFSTINAVIPISKITK